MIYKADLEKLKEQLTNSIGKKVVVEGALKRGKTFDVGIQSEAVITNTYANTFYIKSDGRMYNYQYKDVLDKTIDVKLFDGEDYSYIDRDTILTNPSANL